MIYTPGWIEKSISILFFFAGFLGLLKILFENRLASLGTSTWLRNFNMA
jgi:hypothetical protein